MSGLDEKTLTSFDKWKADVRDEALVIAGLTPDMEASLRDLTRKDYTMFGLYDNETPLSNDSVPLLCDDTLWGLLMKLADSPGLLIDDGVLIGGVQACDGKVVTLSYFAPQYGHQLYFVDDYSLSFMQAWDIFLRHRQYLAGDYEFKHYDEAVQCAAEYKAAIEDCRTFVGEGNIIPGLYCEFCLVAGRSEKLTSF